MMSGPAPASTAAAVLGCSWSPVTVSIATVTPLAAPHSAAWRLNSASAGLTKLVHWSSRMEAPLRGLGMVAVGVELDVPQEMMISGKASVAAATPAVLRKSRRDQSAMALLPCVIAGTPLTDSMPDPPGKSNLNAHAGFWPAAPGERVGLVFMYLTELSGRAEPIWMGRELQTRVSCGRA